MEQIRNLIGPHTHFYELLTFAAGCYILYSFFNALIRAFLSHYILTTFDLTSKYGKNSWALVTGASKGIGLAYCYELAKHGFNIIMVARTVSLMNSHAVALKKLYPVQVKVIMFDLRSDSQAPLLKELEGYDISLFVNNAGTVFMDTFTGIAPGNISEVVNVNVKSALGLVNAMRERMRGRKVARNAIIVVSSVASKITFPYLNLYSPTKAYLSEAIKWMQQKEETDGIDFLLAEYGGVSTTMVPLPPIPGALASAESTARETIRQLGNRSQTHGTIVHEMQRWIMPTEIIKLFIGLMFRFAANSFIKEAYERKRKMN